MTMHRIGVAIGGTPIRLCTSNAEFAGMLRERYSGFLTRNNRIACEFEIETIPPEQITTAEDVTVTRTDTSWIIERGDFQATWTPQDRRAKIRQTANPYSIDSALRIVHSLILATEGGFLLHAASVIRSGKAFIFSGISGAGKTTISRLAPSNVTLLTDEISYVRRDGTAYRAYGTPFMGEMAKPGKNVSAPVAAIYLLAQAPQNRIEDVKPANAVREILRNTLFFAHDSKLVEQVFETMLDVVARVPVKRLSFLPDRAVWDLIA